MWCSGVSPPYARTWSDPWCSSPFGCIGITDADGRHVAGRLKLSLPALIAIAVSGTPLNTDFESEDDLVFDDYFVKPIDFNRLHVVLTRHGAKLMGDTGT